MSDFRPYLLEQLQHILDALGDRMSFEEWYSDECASFEVLIGEPGEHDPVGSEAVSFAWGYLRGAAECADLTVLELLWEHGVSDQPAKKRTKKPAAMSRQKG